MPIARAGGPIGKVLDGDILRIVVDQNRLEASVNFVGEGTKQFTEQAGEKILAARRLRPDLAPNSR
jgi:dihydroxyacid dehydratase/phosphogluconate dehydratase